MSRVFANLCALAMLCLLVARPAAAQQTVNTASLSGRVIDKDGVIAGAKVSARQVATDVTTSVTTDSRGRFRILYLPIGTSPSGVLERGMSCVPISRSLIGVRQREHNSIGGGPGDARRFEPFERRLNRHRTGAH